jgi:hypothetical protein
VGQHQTLPPDQPATPRSSQDHGDRAAADQLSEEQTNKQVRAAEAHAEYLHEYGEPGSERRARIDAATREWLRYRGIPLDGTPEQFHRAVDRLEADTVGYTYYAKVIANQRQHDRDAPLGRRTPEPLDTRQGVER